MHLKIDFKKYFCSFPNNSGMVYSMVDATFGLGFTLGPVLGSVLYVYGGFLTPFLVTGVMLAVGCSAVQAGGRAFIRVHRFPGCCACGPAED